MGCSNWSDGMSSDRQQCGVEDPRGVWVCDGCRIEKLNDLLEEACRLIGKHHIKGKEENEFLRKVKQQLGEGE